MKVNFISGGKRRAHTNEIDLDECQWGLIFFIQKISSFFTDIRLFFFYDQAHKVHSLGLLS